MNKELRQSTILMYDKIYQRFKNTKYIEDPQKISKLLIDSGESYKYIYVVLTGVRYNLTNKKLIEKYSDVINKYLSLANSLNSPHNNYDSWSDIVQRGKIYIDKMTHRDNYLRNKTLILLYTSIQPRRILDYTRLVWIKNAECYMTDTSSNYYIKSTKQIVFNVFKSNINKKQIIKVSDELVDALNNYIKSYNINENALLFNVAKCTIAHQLNRIFKCSVHCLKHSYIDSLFKTV